MLALILLKVGSCLFTPDEHLYKIIKLSGNYIFVKELHFEEDGFFIDHRTEVFYFDPERSVETKAVMCPPIKNYY